ncbi:hypothetical protein HMN09_00013700 [Mycena chlorophos]|uniref:Sacsin/Nov domain-containing protein n=1 Tax=Mycena chlorophos TaxID=658473 RepID=A0A8H6WRY7_MYCCL|nr:hypothetical protein HMN09_00013700 [Mycena chlorophos]
MESPVNEFLTRMGCRADPLLPTLLHEIAVLDEIRDPRSRISEALRLLEEISKHSDEFSPDIIPQILIPDRDGDLHPLPSTFYVDASLERLPPGRIQFLSSLELGDEEEDDGDLQMGEEFTKRIEGVLKEHDIKYALNEFLANAADAGAREFSLVLDERVWDRHGDSAKAKLMSPNLEALQRLPSLFLFNDASFTKDDIDGLRRVGQGGKRLRPDTIGHFGLGALGLFHFTDVVQLVSREWFLILDPSGKHLPPLRGGRPRTSLLRRISEVARRFPGQLAPFEGHFGFSSTSSSYPKTIFRLVLRDGPSELSASHVSPSYCIDLMSGNYRDLAKDAMLFTQLEQITAAHQTPSKPVETMWSVLASRPPEEKSEHREVLVLKQTGRANRAEPQQRWLISRSTTPISHVPAEHSGVLAEMTMLSSQVGLVTCIALRIDSAANANAESPAAAAPAQQPHHLFSSLRLPVVTSLPVHVSASFAISSDRRHIRLDPADHNGNHLPHAAFNVWLLQHLVPPLYISTLAHASQFTQRHNRDLFAKWPRKADKEDEISRIVIDAFYALAVKSTEPICRSAAGQFIPPAQAVIPDPALTLEVRKLLVQMQPADYVAPPYRINHALAQAIVPDGMEQQIRVVDAAYVGSALRAWSDELIAGFVAKQLEPQDIEAVLQFLLSGNVSIADLPLLLLGDGTLATPGPPRYVCDSANPPAIFARSNFLRETVDSRIAKLLKETPDANISDFDVAAVITLLGAKIPATTRAAHSERIAEWVESFWTVYFTLPGPPTLKDIESFALIPTLGAEHISLKHCARLDVFRRPVNHRDLADVISAAERMGFTFAILPVSAREHAECRQFTIETFLEAIENPASPFADLPAREIKHVSEWVQANVHSVRQSEQRQIVRQLPIWPARKGGAAVRVSANELKYVPARVNANVFDQFTPPEFTLAPDLRWLSTVQEWEPARKPLNARTLKQYITIANPLPGLYGPPPSVNSYRDMLTEYLKLDGNDMIPVPDGTMQMRNVEDLYDNTVPLFREALQSQAATSFLHPGLVEGFTEALRGRGLHHHRDWRAFLLCAQTVSVDLTQRNLPEPIVERRAAAVYDFFREHVPALVMGNNDKWRQLDELRFIARRPQRVTAATFDATPFCLPVPMIASPSQLLLPVHVPIAWSQRGVFLQEPSPELIALNKTLGVPTVQQVVNHLAVLALQVAPAYPQNRSLLQQLRATLKFLNDNHAEAQPHILARRAEKLFLNVENADEDDWTAAGQWRSADELQFDLPYDYDNVVGVRQFLSEYRPLVLAAGAGQHHRVQFAASAQPPDSNTLRERFNRMRLARQRLDLKFVPAEPAKGEVIDQTALRVHWTFVAASIPHVATSMDWSDGAEDVDAYPFPGTYFGCLALIDFVYTGKIDAKPADTEDGHEDFLRDLLELLRSADQWHMDDLKDEVGRVIDQWGLLSSATYTLIEENADKYQAKALLEYCHEFRERNPRFLGVQQAAAAAQPGAAAPTPMEE